MKTILLIASLIGIVNSIALIIYALTTKKGNQLTNELFAFLIFMLSIRISKSILVTFSPDLHDFILTLGLSGFLAIGPVFYMLIHSVMDSKFQLKPKHFIHLLPSLMLILLWFLLDHLRSDWNYWHLFYRLILLQYIIYISLSLFRINLGTFNRQDVLKQLNTIGYFLMLIWFVYLLNDVSGFPYISGAILYSVIIYFSLVLIMNKGYVIDKSKPKYKNTGLKDKERQRILKALKHLFTQEQIYRSNTLSLLALSKRIDTSTHALSQVINENYKKTFFEVIAEQRITDAKTLLKEKPNEKISDIAFMVGYNSLSAFNTAFKNATGLTPSKFRNDK